MSLQFGINPLEAAKRADFIREMRLRASESVMDRAKQADFENNMQNTGGFDASDLMKDPEMAQKSTRDQAEKVSEPYRQANMMAAEKTNPMNAESQDPGKIFLQEYLIGPDFSTLKSPGVPILIPRRK